MDKIVMTLSVCVICFNEEKNIRRCLESLSWADEIIVVDSVSEDKTVEIAGEYTNTIFQRPWTGYVDQKNFALSKTHGVWILSVDADEEITLVLRDEILAEIIKHDAKDGYRIPRRSYYQGRWINHSGFYPDRQLRLLRRGRGSWIGQRVHERVQIQGSIGDLSRTNKYPILNNGHGYCRYLRGCRVPQPAAAHLLADDLGAADRVRQPLGPRTRQYRIGRRAFLLPSGLGPDHRRSFLTTGQQSTGQRPGNVH